MNGVLRVSGAESGEHANKNFEIITPDAVCTIRHPGGEVQVAKGEAAAVPPLLKHSVSGAGIRLEIEQALLPFKEITVVRDDRQGGIRHAAEQARRYFEGKEFGRELILEALGGLLVSYFTAFGAGEGLSPAVAAIKNEIVKNLSTPSFSLTDYIKKLPLNGDYVRRLFKKETGVTPHEYLTLARMKLARELLGSGMGNRYTNFSVSQIAEACGFSDPMYFSRVYKNHYGESPSEYAEKARTMRAAKK